MFGRSEVDLLSHKQDRCLKTIGSALVLGGMRWLVSQLILDLVMIN